MDAEGAEEFEALEAACLEEGLLSLTFGGAVRVTKEGREAVEEAALVDAQVANALQQALRAPLLERRAAFVAVVLLVRGRRSELGPA